MLNFSLKPVWRLVNSLTLKIKARQKDKRNEEDGLCRICFMVLISP